MKKDFGNYSDEKIISLFNGDVRNSGWVSARANFLGGLHDEFNNRGYDYSAIGGKESISLAYKVNLINIDGKKTIVIDEEDKRLNTHIKKEIKLENEFKLIFIRKGVYGGDVAGYGIYLVNYTTDQYNIDYDTGGYLCEGEECYKLEGKKKKLKVGANSNVLIEEGDLGTLDLSGTVDLILKGKNNYEINFSIGKGAPSGELTNIDGFDEQGIEMKFKINNI